MAMGYQAMYPVFSKPMQVVVVVVVVSQCTLCTWAGLSLVVRSSQSTAGSIDMLCLLAG